MNLKQRQMGEKKKLSFIVTIVIMIVMALFCVMKILLSGQMIDFIRIGVVGVCLIFVIIAGIAFKNKEGSEMFFTYASGVAYGTVYLTSTDDLYLYAFMFPIIILVLLFQDTRKAILGAIAAIVINIAATVIVIVSGGQMMQVIAQMVFTIVTCVIAVMVIKKLNQHTNETMEAIADSAKAQEGTAREIVGVSENIADKIDGAQGLVTKLNDAISESNSSVNDIAASMKTTAEAIEDQTVMTSDIQENIQQAEQETNNMMEAAKHASATVDEGAKLLEELKQQALETAEVNRSTRATTEELNEVGS